MKKLRSEHIWQKSELLTFKKQLQSQRFHRSLHKKQYCNIYKPIVVFKRRQQRLSAALEAYRNFVFNINCLKHNSCMCFINQC